MLLVLVVFLSFGVVAIWGIRCIYVAVFFNVLSTSCHIYINEILFKFLNMENPLEVMKFGNPLKVHGDEVTQNLGKNNVSIF